MKLTTIVHVKGTIPFVTRDILQACHQMECARKPVKNRIAVPCMIKHDLESVFYVFLWLCTVISGPHFKPRASKFFAFDGLPLYSWFSEDNLRNNAFAKSGQINVPFAFEWSILDNSHIYFGDDFKRCAREFRDLLYPGSRNGESTVAKRYEAKKEPFPALSPKAILEILRILEQKLPTVETEFPMEEGAEDYNEDIHGIPYLSSSRIDKKVEEILYAVDEGNPRLASGLPANGHPASTNDSQAKREAQSVIGGSRAGRTHSMKLRNASSVSVNSSGRKRKGVDNEPINIRNSSASKRLHSDTGSKIV